MKLVKKHNSKHFYTERYSAAETQSCIELLKSIISSKNLEVLKTIFAMKKLTVVIILL